MASFVARRRREPLHRPHGLPHDLDVDRLDAVELLQAVRDRARHVGHERAPAGGRHEVDAHVRALHADVLDDAHVDDADAAVGAAGVVDVAQRRPSARRGRALVLLSCVSPLVECEPEAGGRRSRARDRRERPRRAHAPGVVEPGAAAHDSPAVRASGPRPTPRRCRPAARRRTGRRPRGCAVTGTVQPQPDSSQAQRSGSKLSPQGQVRPSCPRASASHSSPLGRRTGLPSSSAAHAQNASASCSDRPVTGCSASAGASSRAASSAPTPQAGRRDEAPRLRVRHGPAADQHAGERERCAPRPAHPGGRSRRAARRMCRAATRAPARWPSSRKLLPQIVPG